LERGDRHAPDETVVEALAAALTATPAQLDQLRWRAGLTPRGGETSPVPSGADPTLTLVVEALANASLPESERDRLRQAIVRAVPLGSRPGRLPARLGATWHRRQLDGRRARPTRRSAGAPPARRARGTRSARCAVCPRDASGAVLTLTAYQLGLACWRVVHRT